MALVYWYKNDKRVRIDDTNKVATDSFTKKGFGPKESKPKVEEVKKSTSSKKGY